jgi:HK97 family phage major capsid protein
MLDEIKSALAERDGAISGRLSNIETLLKEHSDWFAEMQEAEAKGGQPGRTQPSKSSDEHLDAFCKWFRKPKDQSTRSALEELQAKDVTIGSGSSGGYAVPKQIAQNIERLELKQSPVRSLVSVVDVGSSDFRQLLSLGGASSGWAGEGDVRSATTTPLLREIVPSMGELYALPTASNEILDDAYFSVQDWLQQEVADAFATAEGQAVISGDGTKKPVGMLHTAPVATADWASPLRAAAAYQYVLSPSLSSPAVAEITADALIDLCYGLNSKYRANATWVMNSATAGKIRKLKDSNGQYLWQAGLTNLTPDTLLGRPVAIWEDLDNIGANKLPVAFGDFRRGYLLAQRKELRVTVDEITTPGKTKFYVRRREGGIVFDNDAIKWLKTVTA